jgi:eukaryotic-like serine/threonine-protein kinase
MFKPYNKAEVTFDLVTEIGADGRNSRTFVAKDHQLNAEIVIKQIAKASLASPSNFFDESKALYASAHPNVVQLYYACEDAASIYLAMPYYRRGSVKGLITNRRMTVREIVTTGCQILSGLHNIHSKGLIHFDVKPDNVLLSDRGEALLSDFGLAKPMDLVGLAAQDRFYFKTIPPEAMNPSALFCRLFDIYQFGVTLYRMCNGNEAFHVQFSTFSNAGVLDRAIFRDAVLKAQFPDRRAFAPHIPSKLQNVIKKCLQTDPADRYQSAIDVANALATVDGEALDWCLNEMPDRRIWEKTTNQGIQYLFTVYGSGSCQFQKTAPGGQPRRVQEGCLTAISEAQIRALLGKY